jgi:hypothetical protein
MFALLLLKNWNESATRPPSTNSTWLMYAALGTPSREHVNSVAGIRPWKH